MMNHLLKIFNNELKHLKNNRVKDSEAYNEQTLLEAIRENYDDTAEIRNTKVYKSGDERAVFLKRDTVLSYTLESEKMSLRSAALK